MGNLAFLVIVLGSTYAGFASWPLWIIFPIAVINVIGFFAEQQQFIDAAHANRRVPHAIATSFVFGLVISGLLYWLGVIAGRMTI